MGCYIECDAPNTWLTLYAKSIVAPVKFSDADGTLPICRVNNGTFYAYAVCYDEFEYMRFKAIIFSDRPTDWFVACITDIQKVCKLNNYRIFKVTDDQFNLEGAL